MKKVIAILLLAVVIALPLVSCANGTDSDAEYVEKKGTLVIGITYFEPMNYIENGELTGFETEFAKEVCKILGVTPKFQEINWETKEVELKGKTIDCIWNGLTITDDRKETMSISNAYMRNKQVIVMKKDKIGTYTDAASFKDVKLVAEVESAGEEVATKNDLFKNAKYTAVNSMKDAVMEVAAGTADACIIDYITALGMIGEGTSFEGLAVDKNFAFGEEEYGIAFRKDSDLTAKVNAAIEELKKNGKLEEIANKYKLGEQLIK